MRLHELLHPIHTRRRRQAHAAYLARRTRLGLMCDNPWDHHVAVDGVDRVPAIIALDILWPHLSPRDALHTTWHGLPESATPYDVAAFLTDSRGDASTIADYFGQCRGRGSSLIQQRDGRWFVAISPEVRR